MLHSLGTSKTHLLIHFVVLPMPPHRMVTLTPQQGKTLEGTALIHGTP